MKIIFNIIKYLSLTYFAFYSCLALPSQFTDYKYKADNGSEPHQFAVGKAYFENGNISESLKYFILSARKGNKESIKWIEHINKKLNDNNYYYLGQIKITDAPFYVGSIATICNKIIEFKPAKDFSYLNMGGKYPNQLIGIEIDNSNIDSFIDKFGTLSLLEDESVCVRGQIRKNPDPKKSSTLNITPNNQDFIKINY